MKRYPIRLVVRLLWQLSLAFLVVGACSPSTSIEQAWSAPRHPPVRLHKVVAVFIAQDGALRRVSEEEMVRRLTGVSAAPGYRVLTEAERSDPTKARAKLQTAGFDGAVVMRMVGRETRIEPAAPAMGYGAWGWGYQSYPVTDTIVRMETNVYSLIEGHLVWSGLSRTFDPESSRELVEEVSEAVAEELTKRGIVSPPTT